MIKVLINNEEVVSNHNLEIKEEMLSTSSTILKNCYPKIWENDKDYVSRFYYPKDYSKCKIYNLPRENTTQEQTGTNLSFETYVGKSTLEDIKFYGNTLQNGTPTPNTPVEIQNVTGLQNIEVCGKNLFNKDTVVAGALSENGGIIISDYKTSDYIAVSPNTTYYKGFTQSARFKYFDINKNSLSNVYNDIPDAGDEKAFTTPANAHYIRFSIAPYLDLSTIQIEKGNQATEYEPYKGNTYEVNLGKNLLDLEDGTYSNNDITAVVENGKITLNGTNTSNAFIIIPVNLNVIGKYTLSTSNNETTANVSPRFDSGLLAFNCSNINASTTDTFNSLTTLTNFVIRVQSGSNLTNFVIYPQLEKGSQATSYSPYFTPIELNKIGDYQDRIYKDNGKWYVEKQTGRYNIDTSQITLRSNYTNVEYAQIPKASDYIGYNVWGAQTYLCSHAQWSANPSNWDSVDDINKIYSGTSLTSWWIGFAKGTGLTTIQEELNGAYIYYPLITPTYTEITNEELINQLESLNIELYENQTNFIISGSLPMPTYIKIYTNFEELIFCGFTKNTGNVSLNPREFHGVDLQILDFKDLLSTGETLNYVIANKTIIEAINQVVNSISDYGFVVGEIQLLNPDEIIGAYSTLNKTAYDVFQYFAEITQSRWTTRLIDENTIAIDFYDPSLMPTGVDIDKTQTFYENYKIIDMSFNYSTNDYRNKQIMTSDEVYANITQTETIIADGYATSFMCQNKIGLITSITLNGVEKTFATKSEEQLGITADFIYQPGETTFTSNDPIGAGGVIVIIYYPIVKGREIILNNVESNRIESQINRNGTISRYENRNDTTSSQELQKIGQSYIKYKGKAEINLKIVSELNTWNVGEIVSYNAPISELSTTYMVKSKQISMYLNANKIIYTYNLTSNYNCENAINYFDNQRAKNQGNIGEGETITRNIDLENEALILFYDTEINEIQVQNPTLLDFALDGILI